LKADIAKRSLLVGALALLAGCGVGDLVTEARQGLNFFVVNERLMMRGEVIGRTPAAFADVIAQNNDVTMVVLQDMRGIHDAEAVRVMGRMIRARGLGTALHSDSVLEGVAVDLFLSGVARGMVAGAQITFVAGQSDEARQEYLREMLGTDGFYEFALQTAPADGIHMMTEDEITQNGLLTTPVERLN
tara:strand:- start:15 stop:578 length:564 start_codon:yes stop_codon:yes gene_type:complete